MTETASPRGYRNNNPLNLRHSDDQWQGMSAQQSGLDFVQFETPEAGIRAGAKNLFNYQARYGLNTVEGIVSRWAPPSENDTGAYVSAVSQALGVEPGAPLDLSDPATLSGLTKAMIAHENGMNPYTDEQIAAGVAAAMTGGDLSDRVPQQGAQGAPEPAGPSGITYSDLTPPSPYTPEEQAAIDAAFEQAAGAGDDYDFWDGLGDAFWEDSTIKWQLKGRGGFVPDPSWRMSDEYLKDLVSGPETVAKLGYAIPEDSVDVFEDAVSPDHAKWLRDRLVERLQANQRVASLGSLGTGLQIGAALLDPVTLGATMLTGGLAAPATFGLRLGLGTRAAFGAAQGALSGVASEALMSQFDKVGEADILMAAGGGALWGAAFSPLLRNAPEVREAMEKAGWELRGQAKAVAAGEPRQSTTGAMQVGPGSDPLLVADAAYLASQSEEAPRSAATHFLGRPIRWDAVGQLKSSNNGFARLVGGALAEDAVGNADNSVNHIGASEELAHMQRVNETAFYRTYKPAYAEYRKRNGISAFSQSGRRDFNADVTAYIRNTDPLREFDPAVSRVGDRVRKQFEEWRKLAENPFVREGGQGRPVAGFDAVPSNPHYVPRILDSVKFRDAVNRLSVKNLQAAVKEAIVAAQPGLAQDYAEKLAKAYLETIRKVDAGLDVRAGRALGGENLELLADLLQTRGGLSRDDANFLVRGLAHAPDAGAPPRGKHRLLLDENALLRVRTRDGGVEDFRLADLWADDVEQLFGSYNRQMAGLVALARVRVRGKDGDLLVDGLTSDAEVDALLEKVRAAGMEDGVRGTALDKDQANLRFLVDAIRGRPAEGSDTPAAEFLRMVRDYNFIRVMNQVGFAQIPEMMVALGQVGLRAALQHMPSFRRVLSASGETLLESGFARELEAVFGVGTDRLRGIVSTRWDDTVPAGRLGEGGTLANKARAVLDQGKRITADISLMAPINMALQRWAAAGIVQRFADMAHEVTGVNVKRMRSLGLDDGTLRRVLAELRTHGSFEQGWLTGQKVRRMNLEGWTDLDAKAAFEASVSRWARRAIQENDLGMLHRWMRSPLMQTLLQFRTFMLGAWSKNLLHNVHMRDFSTFVQFSLSLVAAGLVYAAQTKLQAIGRSDREEWEADRLSLSSIARAAFQRAGFASIFPLAVDSAVMGMNEDPVFNFRGSGLPSNALFGNPTVSLLFDNALAPLALGKSVLSGEMPSQQTMRKFQQLLPFQNFLPMAGLYGSMISRLPERGGK